MSLYDANYAQPARPEDPRIGSVLATADIELAALRSRAEAAEREVTRLQVAEGAAEEEIREKTLRLAETEAALAVAGEALKPFSEWAATLAKAGWTDDLAAENGMLSGVTVSEVNAAAAALSDPARARAAALDRARREVVLIGAEVERVYLDDNCTCEHETSYRCTGCRFATALQDVRRLEAQPEKETQCLNP